MEQINTGIFYFLGKWLDSCYVLARQPLKEFIVPIYWSHYNLTMLVDGSAKYRLVESAESARLMLGVLDMLRGLYEVDATATLDDQQVQSFNTAYQIFEQAIGLELGRSPIFFVTPKGVYATRTLIQNGSKVYEGFMDRLPKETLVDTDQAAKCLAFALATAAGFHIARATEAVMVKAMGVFGCPRLKDSQRNWGAYIDALERCGANKKVIHHLRQLKDLHRNPLIHPEVSLIQTEANQLWALCVSAIQAMVADMETKSAIPSEEILAMIPKDYPNDEGT